MKVHIEFKRTPGEKKFIALPTGETILTLYHEIFYTDTGKKRDFIFAFKSCYRENEEIKDTIVMDIEIVKDKESEKT
jgi:hypothetical protein